MNQRRHFWLGSRSLLGLLLGTLRLLPRLLRGGAPVELGLLLAGLEAAMPHLRGSIDELQLHLLRGLTAHLRQQRLPQGDDALAAAHDRALHHHPILGHLAVVGEAAHGRDALLRQVVLRHGVVGVVLDRLANAVDLLVDLRTVVVATLTRTRHLELHACRVPRANACNLTQPAVGLARKPRDAPSSHHAVEALTLGGTNDVNHLVLAEDTATFTSCSKRPATKSTL